MNLSPMPSNPMVFKFLLFFLNIVLFFDLSQSGKRPDPLDNRTNVDKPGQAKKTN
jgi:hypothetical protein